MVPGIHVEGPERSLPCVSEVCSPLWPYHGPSALYKAVGPGGGQSLLQDYNYVPGHRGYLSCPRYRYSDPGIEDKGRKHLASSSDGVYSKPSEVLPCSLAGDDTPGGEIDMLAGFIRSTPQ